jgi:hypothetical protein
MFARLRWIALALVTIVALPSLGHAQQAPVTAPVPAAGPRLDHSAVAMKRLADPSSETTTLQRRQPMGKPVALMVVGGAAVVLGALIGDDVGTIFMIGGAVALLVGLYQYLR